MKVKMNTGLILSAVTASMLIVAGCAAPRSTEAPKAGATAKAGETKPLTAKDVVARYKKAAFGGDGIRKNGSTTMKGTLGIEQYGIEGPFVSYSMSPDSNVTNLEVMGMKVSNGCHKGVCWAQQPGGGTTTLTGDMAAMQLQQSDYNQWDHLDRYYASLELVDPPAGKESTSYKIKAVKKNGDTDYFDFSKETGLLTAAVFDGETPQGRMTIGIQFNKYKEFGGTMFPTELIESVPQGTVKLTFTEVSFAPLTEDKFAKP